MLIVKGTRIIFVLKEGRDVHAPSAHGLSHDPSGRDWPSKSVLVGKFSRTQAPIEDPKARQYLGRTAHVRAADISVPQRKSLGDWTKVGDVEKVFYTRLGTKYPGPFQHGFNKGWRSLLGKKRVILYKRPGFFRLEFPDGATLDDRGFVIP